MAACVAESGSRSAVRPTGWAYAIVSIAANITAQFSMPLRFFHKRRLSFRGRSAVTQGDFSVRPADLRSFRAAQTRSRCILDHWMPRISLNQPMNFGPAVVKPGFHRSRMPTNMRRIGLPSAGKTPEQKVDILLASPHNGLINHEFRSSPSISRVSITAANTPAPTGIAASGKS